MRLNLHLERLQFAGSQRLLILISLTFFTLQSLQVLVGVCCDHDGSVDEYLVGKTEANDVMPRLKRARDVSLCCIIIVRNQHPQNGAVKQDKGDSSQTPGENITTAMFRKAEKCLDKIENGRSPEAEAQRAQPNPEEKLCKPMPEMMAIWRPVLQSHQQCEPTPKGKREHISSDDAPPAGPPHRAILCEN